MDPITPYEIKQGVLEFEEVILVSFSTWITKVDHIKEFLQLILHRRPTQQNLSFTQLYVRNRASKMLSTYSHFCWQHIQRFGKSRLCILELVSFIANHEVTNAI